MLRGERENPDSRVVEREYGGENRVVERERRNDIERESREQR